MEELLATDGTMSEEETIAAEGINLDEVDEEATDYEEEDTTDVVEPEIVEEVVTPKPQPKVNKVAKILAERNEAKKVAQEQAREIALFKLEKTLGEFNHDEVKAYLDTNPTLPVEDAVILWKAKQPKQEVPRKSTPIVWSEARNLWSNTITNADLLKLPQNLYNVAMEKIEKGQLAVK